MDFSTFKESIKENELPDGLSIYLQSLWWDGKGDWHKAHSLIDSLGDDDAAFLHAYLHRKEGDPANAAYWYRKAGRTDPGVSLEEEWNAMVRYFLKKG